MLRVLPLFLILSLALSACSVLSETLDDEPEPGRCSFHTDCEEGQKCHNTFCEDVYFPRRDIKTN